MPKKSVREMNWLQRQRYSLASKTFHSVLLMAILLSAAAIGFGFFLYSASVRKEYRSVAHNISTTASAAIEKEELTQYAKKVLDAYATAREELAEAPDSGAYRRLFDGIEDEEFKRIQSILHKIEVSNSAKAVYFAAIDEEAMRMIFIIDSNQGEDYCPPGSWDTITEKELQGYNGEGRMDNLLDYFSASTSRGITSAITNTEQYGYLCTSNKEIVTVDGYRVMAFADVGMEHVVEVSKQFLLQYCVYMALVSIVLTLIMSLLLKRRVARPINQLAEAAYAYTKDKANEQRTGRHFDTLDIHTGDEIENLSLTLKDMENDLANYVQNLTKVTAEKERISTELNVASQIQEGVIPSIFPAFPERPEFDLYASMHAAKEVGGDFYDFFLIDEDHLALVMADVSGKGIPAALFMMASKIMINNVTIAQNNSPAKILETVNEQLCMNNPTEMFVTTWLGILEISTGSLRAANAGHEYPAVRRRDGKYELLKDTHGFVLGGMKGAKFREYEIKFEPGDSFFVYTDGVVEANDPKGELFGTDRMLEVLNAEPATDPDKVLVLMREGIQRFAKDAEQFDDITMLCMRYNGGTKNE